MFQIKPLLSEKTIAVILDKAIMTRILIYTFFCSVLFINCSNEIKTTKLVEITDTTTNKKSIETLKQETNYIEVNCDSIYINKNYKIKLFPIDNESNNTENYNYIFVVQKIIRGQEVPIYLDTIESKTREIKFVDYNNDKIKDILIQNISDVRSNLTYYLYIAKLETDTFVKIKNFGEIKNPNYLAKYNLIDNYVMSGQNWKSFYKIKGDSIKDFNIVIYDNETQKFDNECKKAIETILTKEKNNR